MTTGSAAVGGKMVFGTSPTTEDLFVTDSRKQATLDAFFKKEPNMKNHSLDVHFYM